MSASLSNPALPKMTEKDGSRPSSTKSRKSSAKSRDANGLPPLVKAASSKTENLVDSKDQLNNPKPAAIPLRPPTPRLEKLQLNPLLKTSNQLIPISEQSISQILDQSLEDTFSLLSFIANDVGETSLKTILQSKMSVSDEEVSKIEVMGSLLDREKQYLQALQEFAGTKPLDIHSSRISQVLSSREKRVQLLDAIQKEIIDITIKAKEDEDAKRLDALKGFDTRFQGTILPPMATVLKLNLDNLSSQGLVTFSAEDEAEDDEKIMLNRLQKNLQLLQRIKKYSFPRTDTCLSYLLFAEQVNPILQIDEKGPLEVETDNIKPSQKSKKEKRKVVFGEEEIRMLNRMNNRVYYLRNPRFPSKRSPLLSLSMANLSTTPVPPKNSDAKKGPSRSEIHTANSLAPAPPTPKTHFASNGIIAEPSIIMFTHYNPHETYCKQLLIRNTTSAAHRFRLSIQPPYKYTQTFSYRLKQCPIDSDGLIAPGLCCIYEISFTPNSLANFEEMLIVSTELGDTFKVPIIAKRNPPVLTLPFTLDCGYCRAGFTTKRTFKFVNKGGPGRFLLMPANIELDPFEVFQSIGDNQDQEVKFQDYGPFSVFPSYFLLAAGQSGEFQINYTPQDVSDDQTDRLDETLVKIACDNCEVFEYPIVGTAQKPVLEITKLRFHDHHQDEEIPCDAYYNAIVKFGEQNPKATSTAFITIENRSEIRLPFRWAMIDNPGMNLTLDSKKETSNASCQISPSKGFFEPHSACAFRINFCPASARTYDFISELLLQRDLDVKSDHVNDSGILGNPTEEFGTRIRICGKGTDYQVEYAPQIIQPATPLYCGDAYQKSMTLTNMSISAVDYEFSIEGIDPAELEVELQEPSGRILPHSCKQLIIRLCPFFPGEFQGVLHGKTANGLGPDIQILIRGTAQLRPLSLDFNADLVDFGLLSLGESRSSQISLVNRSEFTMLWKGTVHNKSVNDNETAYFSYKPSGGLIRPGETQVIDATFVPTWYQTLDGIFQCKIHGLWKNDPSESVRAIAEASPGVPISSVQMIARVETPMIRAINTRNYFTCFAGVPFKWKITLKNMRMLPAKFKWQNISTDSATAIFSPQEGNLAGGDMVEVEVLMTFSQVGEIRDFHLLGDVEGMVEQEGKLFISVDVDVLPIYVSFRILENEKAMAAHAVVERPSTVLRESAASMRFDFGRACPIFATRCRTLVIRNHSAMQSPFKIWFEKYTPTAQVDDPVLEASREETAGSKAMNLDGAGSKKGTPEHSKTPVLLKSKKANKIGFSSKSGQGYIDSIKKVRQIIERMQNLLSDGRGAAFHASPSQGMIQPWGQVEIKVTSYNNLVGLYEDNLICEIGDWQTRLMPVRLGVVGTPIKFSGPQLVAKKKEETNTIDRVNFGSRVINPRWGGGNGVYIGKSEGSDLPDAFVKSIIVENQSPRDVVLHWKVYIRHIRHDRSASQIREGTSLVSPADDKEDDIMLPQNLVGPDQLGILGVSPSSMTIPAFKSAPFKCLYRCAVLGTFDALVVADVGYVEQDGTIRYAPKNNGKAAGEMTLLERLKSVAKLHIQAKCIEPRLGLDTGDRIRIKPSPRIAGEEQPMPSAIAFLKNNSDAVCAFAMETYPSDLFSVVGSAKYRKAADDIKSSRNHQDLLSHAEMYELKPTEQLLLTAKYKGVLSKRTEVRQEDNNHPSESRSYRVLATGELRITFSNGMTQSLPISLEEKA